MPPPRKVLNCVLSVSSGNKTDRALLPIEFIFNSGDDFARLLTKSRMYNWRRNTECWETCLHPVFTGLLSSDVQGDNRSRSSCPWAKRVKEVKGQAFWHWKIAQPEGLRTRRCHKIFEKLRDGWFDWVCSGRIANSWRSQQGLDHGKPCEGLECYSGPDWCGSVGWVLSHLPKGGQAESMPSLGVQSPG